MDMNYIRPKLTDNAYDFSGSPVVFEPISAVKKRSYSMIFIRKFAAENAKPLISERFGEFCLLSNEKARPSVFTNFVHQRRAESAGRAGETSSIYKAYLHNWL